MDVVTYGALMGQIKKDKTDVSAVEAALETYPSGYSYKGTVTTVSDLPDSAEVGDMYIVTGEGNAEYAWDGTTWGSVTKAITEQEIDTLY